MRWNTWMKRKIQSKSETKWKGFPCNSSWQYVLHSETFLPGNCDETRTDAFTFSYIKVICRKELSISLWIQDLKKKKSSKFYDNIILCVKCNATPMSCTGRQFYITFISVLILNATLFYFYISNLKSSLKPFPPKD